MKLNRTEFDLSDQVDKVTSAAVELDRLRASHARLLNSAERRESQISSAEARLQVAKMDLRQMIFDFAANAVEAKGEK